GLGERSGVDARWCHRTRRDCRGETITRAACPPAAAHTSEGEFMRLPLLHSRTGNVRIAASVLWLLVAASVSPAFAQFPVRPAPPLPPPSGPVVNVSTVSELQAAMDAVTSGTTIVVAPGTYRLTNVLRFRGGVNHVALRGATGNRDDVRILG